MWRRSLEVQAALGRRAGACHLPSRTAARRQAEARCHQPPAPCADRETIWRTALSPYFADLFTGRPACGIVNRLMREIGPMSAAAPPFPLATSAIAALRAPAESLGRDDFSPLWAGQNTRGCKAIPAAELTLELARGFATASRGT